MAGGFFNRLYLGNARKPDFRKEDLPSNRFKLFFDMLGIRFWKLIQLNLIYLLFLIPILVWTFMNVLVLASQKTELEGYILTYLLVLIPLLIITGPATAGLSFVLRNWARDENAWVWSDFKENALKNWKESMLIMFLNGVIMVVFFVNFRFYSAMGQNNFGFMVLRNLLIGLGLIYAMMNIYIFPMLVTYKLKIRDVLRNAFIFTIVRFPYSLLFFILTIFPAILTFFNPVFSLYYVVIGFSLTGFILASYTNATFDKYLNPSLEGAELNRGLRDPD